MEILFDGDFSKAQECSMVGEVSRQSNIVDYSSLVVLVIGYRVQDFAYPKGGGADRTC